MVRSCQEEATINAGKKSRSPSSRWLVFKKREAPKSAKGQKTEALGDEAKAHASRSRGAHFVQNNPNFVRKHNSYIKTH